MYHSRVYIFITKGTITLVLSVMKLVPRVPRNQRQQRKWPQRQGMRNNKNQPPIKSRDASVTVRPDWTTIEEMDFPRLAKLSLPNVKEGEDM